MAQIINNTDQIKHLPYRNVTLMPGDNQVDEGKIKDNIGHPGFDSDVEAGRIEIPDELFDNSEDNGYPIKISENGWHRLSNGEKVLGEDNAIEAQQELNENG